MSSYSIAQGQETSKRDTHYYLPTPRVIITIGCQVLGKTSGNGPLGTTDQRLRSFMTSDHNLKRVAMKQVVIFVAADLDAWL